MVRTLKYSALFLDRDGVLNRRLPGRYVQDWSAFHWLPGNPQAVARLSAHFRYLFVVTNQQGVGKGLMGQDELEAVHQRMKEEIERAGGRIDRIYTCTALKTEAGNCRKPSPSMGLQAARDFPDIDFSRSVMVGDSLCDLQFGQSLGMKNVWVRGKAEEEEAILAAQQRGALDIWQVVGQLEELDV